MNGSDTGSQLTAETESVEIDGATLVYRRFGNQRTGAAPLVCLQHFRGNLDFWDPILMDRVALDREVILLANRGVGSSTGVVPDNVTDMARDVYAHACADEITPEHALNVFFSGSQESRTKGIEYLQRTQRRQSDRDAATDLATRDAA